jgi:hypothetical protein
MRADDLSVAGLVGAEPTQAAERPDDELAVSTADEHVPRAAASPPDNDLDGPATLAVEPRTGHSLCLTPSGQGARARSQRPPNDGDYASSSPTS